MSFLKDKNVTGVAYIVQEFRDFSICAADKVCKLVRLLFFAFLKKI